MRSTLKLSRERLRIVEARYTIGNSSRLELQQAKVDFNADSSNVLSQHQVVHASRIRLNELMALPDVDALTVVQDSSIISNLALDENTMWTNTLANNTSLRIMQKEVRLSELDYKKIKSRNYPTVRLTAGYGYIANWYGNSTTDLQRRWGANYGMNVAIPIFDGLNRRREQRNARLEIENTTLRTEELLLQLKADMSNLWMSYKNNLSLCALEYENTTIARDNYGIAIDRYKLGDLSGIELREAQNSLFQAEERLAAAEYATKVCEISLLQLSGQIIR